MRYRRRRSFRRGRRGGFRRGFKRRGNFRRRGRGGRRRVMRIGYRM